MPLTDAEVDIDGIPTAPLVAGQPKPHKSLLQMVRDAPRPENPEPLTLAALEDIMREVWDAQRQSHPTDRSREN